MKMNEKKDTNTDLNMDGLALGHHTQDGRGAFFARIGVLLALLIVTGFLGSLLGGRARLTKISNLEEENRLLRAKVEQYSATVDSIYSMLDSLGLTKKDKRDYPYYSGGATEFPGYSRDPQLKLSMENTEQKLSEILAFMQPKFPSAELPILARDELSGDIPSIYPTFGRISDHWGWRTHPITKNLEFHHGIDICNESGTPIYATAAGVVTESRYTRGYGRHIIIDHGNGYESLYAHLCSQKIEKGDLVTKGQIVGLMGNTGLSTGSHLHYEVRYHNRKMNPANFLNRIEQYAQNK